MKKETYDKVPVETLRRTLLKERPHLRGHPLWDVEMVRGDVDDQNGADSGEASRDHPKAGGEAGEGIDSGKEDI